MSFVAPRWLGNGDLQTVGAALPFFSPPRSHRSMPDEDLLVPVGDGGKTLARAWWNGSASTARRTAVLVHGIGGSSESRYMLRAAAALHRGGLHVLRVNLRGAGAGLAHARSIYHAGLTADLEPLLAFIARDLRVRDVALVGFSGGGSIVLKLAGEWGSRAPSYVSAVASVSAPLDYVKIAAHMERLRTLPYRRYVLGNLVRQASQFARLNPELASRVGFSIDGLRRMRTFREWDEQVMVPMHGFESVEEYRVIASSGPRLAAIAIPSLVVHADDDPMVPGRTLLPWIDAASRAVRFERTPRGGHIGWIGGFDEAAFVNTWAMSRVLDFLHSC